MTLRAVFLLCLIQTVKSLKQPNIVLMMADDLGWRDVPWHDSLAKAPTLSGLANSGIILDRHYVQPICSPTRGALMTGKYPTRLGLQHMIIGSGEPWGLAENETIIAQHMKDLGYYVHGVGKWHLGYCSWASTPVGRGFDSFFGYYNGACDYYTKDVPDLSHKNFFDFRYNTLGGHGKVNDDILWSCNQTYSSYNYADQANKVISEHDQSKPLFLYFPIQDPHFPSEVPSKYYDLYEGVVKNEKRRTLLAMVSALDDAAEVVVSSLKDAGMWDNTVFIFFSDNGGQVGRMSNGQINYPLRGGKATYWEGGIRSSSFVYSPMIKGGFTNTELLHVTDWLPTITHLAACGVEDDISLCQGPALGEIDGVNQWATILGASKSNRTEFLVNIDPLGSNAALRMGSWKLLQGNPGRGPWVPPPSINNELFEKQFTDPGGLDTYYRTLSLSELQTINAESLREFYARNQNQNETIQLYNVDTDPYEKEEVSKENPEIVQTMLKRLEYYRNKSVPPKNCGYDPASDPTKFGGVWTPWMDSC